MNLDITRYLLFNTVWGLVKFPGPAAFIVLTLIVYSTPIISEVRLMLVPVVFTDINTKSDDILYCTS